MRTQALFTFYMFCLSALVIALLVFTTSSVNAAETPTVAVVNVQKIMRDSKAANAVREQVKAKQKSFQDELDAKENELQKEDQELAKQRSVLSKEAFEEKYVAFRKKAADAQQQVRTKRVQLDKGTSAALSQIQKTVVDIVEAVAKEKGVDAVISASQMLYADPKLDITGEVLTKLDQQLPNLNVNFSQ